MLVWRSSIPEDDERDVDERDENGGEQIRTRSEQEKVQREEQTPHDGPHVANCSLKKRSALRACAIRNSHAGESCDIVAR